MGLGKTYKTYPSPTQPSSLDRCVQGCRKKRRYQAYKSLILLKTPHSASSMVKIQEELHISQNLEVEFGSGWTLRLQQGRKHNLFVRKSCEGPARALNHPAGEGRDLHCFPPLSATLKGFCGGPATSLSLPSYSLEQWGPSVSRPVVCRHRADRG